MKIFVRVKPIAKRNEIKVVDSNHFTISVKESPVNGKANRAVIKLLSEFYKITKSKILIKSGIKSREKIVEILK